MNTISKVKIVDGIRYVKIGEVARIVERSTQSIKLWYDYAKENPEVDLPPYRTDLDGRGIRYWKEDDVPKLITFRDTIVRGMMSDFNVNKWGDKGKAIIRRGNQYGMKRFNKEEEKQADK